MNKEDFQIFKNNTKNISSGNENKSVLSSDYFNLIYLDNASTSQIPNQVLEAMNYYYTNHKSNIDRGLYSIEETSTQKYEESRKKVASFLNVNNDEIIFTSGATDSSNKLILMIEKHLAKYPGLYKTKNEILISNTAHNSELIPLQEYAKRNSLIIKVLSFKDIESNISEKTLIVSMQLVSNFTGEIFDIKSIIERCKLYHSFSICDMSAGVGHISIDVKELDFDSGYFSAHKMCGPTGVGILFIKREYSREMLPVTFGGGMVWQVSEKDSSYRSDVKLFEAGTQNIAGVIGFGAACDYIKNIGLENIYNHNQELLKYFYKNLNTEENRFLKNNIKIYSEGDLEKNIGIISFEIKNEKGESVHAHDVAQILADYNICVRSGKHCADLFLQENNIPVTTRVSFYLYNSKQDIEMLFVSLKQVINKFKI